MSDIESPCIRNCCLDENDICMGCFRHINEIMQWSAADKDLKTKILKIAKQRKNIKTQRRHHDF